MSLSSPYKCGHCNANASWSCWSSGLIKDFNFSLALACKSLELVVLLVFPNPPKLKEDLLLVVFPKLNPLVVLLVLVAPNENPDVLLFVVLDEPKLNPEGLLVVVLLVLPKLNPVELVGLLSVLFPNEKLEFPVLAEVLPNENVIVSKKRLKKNFVII